MALAGPPLPLFISMGCVHVGQQGICAGALHHYRTRFLSHRHHYVRFPSPVLHDWRFRNASCCSIPSAPLMQLWRLLLACPQYGVSLQSRFCTGVL